MLQTIYLGCKGHIIVLGAHVLQNWKIDKNSKNHIFVFRKNPDENSVVKSFSKSKKAGSWFLFSNSGMVITFIPPSEKYLEEFKHTKNMKKP